MREHCQIGGRLVVCLEFGNTIRIRCLDCNRHSEISRDEMLGTWRAYLNAPFKDIWERMKCSCGGRRPQAYTVNGRYADGGMMHDSIGNRARWIR